MTWFEELAGFAERSPEQVRGNITVNGETLASEVNGRVMACGRLETPTFGELRERVATSEAGPGALSLREVVANVQDLHTDPANAGALFQVASQFNLLEMTSPSVTPEQGVGIYEYDRTQGPACAIAAGAGTIYRNYFAPVNGQVGQTEGNQIDCLADLGKALGNTDSRLWEMRNGYALASREGLFEISSRLQDASEEEIDALRELLRLGIQWNAEVTLNDAGHNVSQVYCSALPVAYSRHPADLWEDFARLVLEAAYEATICTAILNARSTGNNRVFLTLLGGGAFGNRTSWIMDAMQRALKLYQDWGIEAVVVSYSQPNPHMRELMNELQKHKKSL